MYGIYDKTTGEIYVFSEPQIRPAIFESREQAEEICAKMNSAKIASPFFAKREYEVRIIE